MKSSVENKIKKEKLNQELFIVRVVDCIKRSGKTHPTMGGMLKSEWTCEPCV